MTDPSVRCYNTGMKTALYLLGLFLAAMACVAARSSYSHDWDVIELGLAAGLLASSVALLRHVGKMYDSPR